MNLTVMHSKPVLSLVCLKELVKSGFITLLITLRLNITDTVAISVDHAADVNVLQINLLS